MCCSPNAKDKPLASGIPPWHACVFVSSLLAASLWGMPSLENLDKYASIETFTHRIFPDLLSLSALAAIRGLVAITIFSVTLEMVLHNKGWDIYTNYRPATKLINCWITLKGARTLIPFTTFSWNFLGIYYSLSAYIAYSVAKGDGEKIDAWILRSALFFWELAAPFAILVSTVIRYAIWPIAKAGGKPHTLTSFRNQMMHNMNSIFALTEMALLGGLPIFFSHIAFPCLIGTLYILFSWGMCKSHSRQENGPQYVYFFFDTTLGKKTTFFLAALLTTLVSVFVIFWAMKEFIGWVGGRLVTHLLCVTLVASLVCRTKD